MAIQIYLHHIDNSSAYEQPKLIYDSEQNNKYNIVPGTLKKQLNKPDYFEFDAYLQNEYDPDCTDEAFGLDLYVGFSYISIEDTEYSNDDNNGILFYGRISGIVYEMSGVRHVSCDGLLSNLSDFPMYMPSSENPGNGRLSVEEFDKADGIHNVHTRDTKYIFQYAITAYNEGTERKDVVLGNVSRNNIYTKEPSEDDDDNWFSFKYPWDQSVLDFITSNLINVYGGLLEITYNKKSNGRIQGIINWNDEPIGNKQRYKNRKQDIVYSENLIDVTYEDITAECISGITALGKNKWGGSMFQSNRYNGHNRPAVYYGNNFSGGYDPIKNVRFDQARTFAQLEKQANRYANLHCSNRKFRISGKCLDRHFIDIFNDGNKNFDLIDIGYTYTVEVAFPYMEINEELVCLSCEIDIGDMKNSSYIFGDYIPPDLIKSRYITG